MGVVYLIQPVELIGTDRYKVGCSHKDDVSRITTGYNLTTHTYLVHHVDDPFEVETRIVRAFADRFQRLPGSREYFAGNILHMMACFRAITSDTLDAKLASLPPLQPLLKNQCPKCRKVFCNKYKLRDHAKKCNGLDSKQCENCFKLFTTRQAKYNHKKYVKCKPPTDTTTAPCPPIPVV